MITEETTLAELVLMLAGAGLRIDSVTREERRYRVWLSVEPAHRTGGLVGLEASGESLAAAIEEARFAWASWPRK